MSFHIWQENELKIQAQGSSKITKSHPKKKNAVPQAILSQSQQLSPFQPQPRTENRQSSQYHTGFTSLKWTKLRTK